MGKISVGLPCAATATINATSASRTSRGTSVSTPTCTVYVSGFVAACAAPATPCCTAPTGAEWARTVPAPSHTSSLRNRRKFDYETCTGMSGTRPVPSHGPHGSHRLTPCWTIRRAPRPRHSGHSRVEFDSSQTNTTPLPRHCGQSRSCGSGRPPRSPYTTTCPRPRHQVHFRYCQPIAALCPRFCYQYQAGSSTCTWSVCYQNTRPRFSAGRDRAGVRWKVMAFLARPPPG